MKETRYYWGDLLLWKTGLDHEDSGEALGAVQEFGGVDQTQALIVPTSRAWKRKVNVSCFFDPYADAYGRYTRASHRANVASLYDALRTRSDTRYPLFYCDDVSGAAVVSTYVGNILTTVAAHGLTTGDVVLIRRNGQDLFTYGSITVTGGSTFTIASSHSILAGDNVLLVNEYWTAMSYVSQEGIKRQDDGAYYAKEVVYPFVGGVTTHYPRQSVTRP